MQEVTLQCARKLKVESEPNDEFRASEPQKAQGEKRPFNHAEAAERGGAAKAHRAALACRIRETGPLSERSAGNAPTPVDCDRAKAIRGIDGRPVAVALEDGGAVTAPACTVAGSAEGASDDALSADKTRVLASVRDGTNVFFTGAAGTGKTFLMRRIAQELKRLRGEERVFVTSSTGVSACVLSGSTLHWFSGLRLGRGSVADLLRDMCSEATERWKITEVLLVDEISMLTGEFFDKVEQVARIVRGDRRPFGGVQVIACGDFFQLPPVFSERERTFCFEARCWNKVMQEQHVLQTCFRHKDRDLLTLLADVRSGCLGLEGKRLMQCIVRPRREFDNPTMLFTHCKEAQDMNALELDKLPGQEVVFSASSYGRCAKTLEKSCPAVARLALKVGARVILLHNMDVSKGLCNGAGGSVVKFIARSGEVVPVVAFSGENVLVERHSWKLEQGGQLLARFTQTPLLLGWALTVHKVCDPSFRLCARVCVFTLMFLATVVLPFISSCPVLSCVCACAFSICSFFIQDQSECVFSVIHSNSAFTRRRKE